MGAPARRRGVYVAALIERRPKLISQTLSPIHPPSLRAKRSNPDSLRGGILDYFVARAPRNDVERDNVLYDLLLPATAATGAGGSDFWNISSGRKMTRP